MARVGNDGAVEVTQQLTQLQNVHTDAVSGPRTPEALADLFTPDIVLPEQFIQGARRDSFISGEKALMLAVLEDGIRCFQEHLRNPRSNPRMLSQEAEAWIKAVDYDWPFSFHNVCETLGIDADALRGALLTWKAQRLADVRRARQADADREEGLPPPPAHEAHERHPLAVSDGAVPDGPSRRRCGPAPAGAAALPSRGVAPAPAPSPWRAEAAALPAACTA